MRISNSKWNLPTYIQQQIQPSVNLTKSLEKRNILKYFKIVSPHCGKIRNLLSPKKFRQINYLVIFFSKFVDFTKFLPKYSGSAVFQV